MLSVIISASMSCLEFSGTYKVNNPGLLKPIKDFMENKTLHAI